jgi:thioredoxin-like negative regulator of GroEL
MESSFAFPVAQATPDTFDALTTETKGPLVIVYFWGPQCPNCEIFAREMPEVLSELSGAEVSLVKTNAYEYPELARRFAIAGIPAFVLFRNGVKLGMMRQYYGKDYFVSVVTEQLAKTS